MNAAEGWLREAPATHVTGAHLTLRRWTAADVGPLTAAITSSFESLLPWLHWVAGYDRAAAQGFVARAGDEWARRIAFHYAAVDPTDRVLGGAALRASSGRGGLAIDYWVRTDATRQRVATRAAALLTAAALALSAVDHVEIHHDRANEISGRVPRRLGFQRSGTGPRPRTSPGHSGVDVRWVMTRAAYAGSMARTLVPDQPATDP